MAPTTVAADGVAHGTVDMDHRSRGTAAGRAPSGVAAALAVFEVDSATEPQAAGLPIVRVDRATVLETVGAATLVPDLEMVREPEPGAAAMLPGLAMARARASAMADSRALDRAEPIVADWPVIHGRIRVIRRATSGAAAGNAMARGPATKIISAIALRASGTVVHRTLLETIRASAALSVGSTAARAMAGHAILVMRDAPLVQTTAVVC